MRRARVMMGALLAALLPLGPALAQAPTRQQGLGDRNVSTDPHTKFPSGGAPGEAAPSLGVHVGGELSRSTMVDHPATEYNGSGAGGTSTLPDRPTTGKR